MMKQIKSGTVYTSTENEIYNVCLGDGLFICGFDSFLKRSFCLWSSSPMSGVELLRLLMQKVPWLSASSSTMTVKIIVEASLSNEIKNVFESLKFSSLKIISRNEVGAALYFYSSSGRLRAEKSAEKIIPLPSKKKIKVLIIDDSLTIHKLLTSIFKKSEEIEVVGAVLDPFKVEDAILRHSPDVLTVDVHMDGMNGVQLLKKILPQFSIPSLLVTSLSINDGPLVLEGLQAGAVDHLQKPTIENLESFAEEIVEKVRAASTAKVKIPKSAPLQKEFSKWELDVSKLVVIGASTGGTEALAHILSRWPSQSPPILVVQHIPAQFSKAFADRLNQISELTVLEGQNDMPVLANHVYVAPGGFQMKLIKNGKGVLKLKIEDSEAVNRHKPSVDVLFRSVLEAADPKQTLGVLLTGMGGDGARGLLELKRAGASTLAQDQESCVVYGMPKVALELGAVDQTISLDNIPHAIFELLSSRRAA